MDNKQLKDGVGNLFTQRMRDVSLAGDGSLMRSIHYYTQYPIDYQTGGIFQHCAKSGTIAAGMVANSPVYAFRWTASLLALIRRVKINAWALGTAFTPGIASFDINAARGWTAGDTGGVGQDLSGDRNQLRSTMSASVASIMVASTAAMVPGTRTTDPDPMDSVMAAVSATANAPFVSATLFDKTQGGHPLLLIANEGFVIRATVPATGTWGLAVTTEWDEVAVF